MELKLKAGQFYGTTSQALSANGFRFTEKAYLSRATLPLHAHELSHFCLVLAGSYNERIAGKGFERGPMALVYYPPDVSHAEEHFTDGRHFLVEIDSQALERITEYGADLCEPLFIGNHSSLWLAARMYREFSERDRFSSLVLESIATELLIAASRQYTSRAERKPPPWLERVKEYLRDNFSAPPSLAELAKAVDIHPTHLARVFRQFERCTVGDYIREARINYARQRILSSNDTLVEISLSAGFADQTHFNRSFKRITGMTPTEFRRTFAGR
jgi:AraC family transcriptional regulator